MTFLLVRALLFPVNLLFLLLVFADGTAHSTIHDIWIFDAGTPTGSRQQEDGYAQTTVQYSQQPLLQLQLPFLYLLAGGTPCVVQLQHVEPGLCGDNLMRFETSSVFELRFIESPIQANHQSLFSLPRDHGILHEALSITIKQYGSSESGGIGCAASRADVRSLHVHFAAYAYRHARAHTPLTTLAGFLPTRHLPISKDLGYIMTLILLSVTLLKGVGIAHSERTQADFLPQAERSNYRPVETSIRTDHHQDY
ncbi:hypothetical protein COCMIDRAFT_35197 [Bipolaris oryzae ATCC 44560]|uniref:Uncharacterized protein n=1 Tax=Bipolaris oryzae ATCC 44560 TaxID=930090 RepID=W6ZU32_COCMI|nr:uncharacterized protein COCMIDRAFT_35197 [Bipolaris oryzae ATCC 44560]EUC47196.1 hypothetical protein COCMIDRAFT_35197 [Bipolaris oryzae ATCC 44560]